MKKFLQTVLYLLFTTLLLGQSEYCDSSSNAVSDRCDSAPTLSLCEIDGKTFYNDGNGVLEGEPIDLLLDGIFGTNTTVEDPKWLKFHVPNGINNILFEIEVNNCNNGNGIQAVILDTDCQTYVNQRSNAVNSVANIIFYISLNSQIANHDYFLLFDSYGGDICSITINVIEGIEQISSKTITISDATIQEFGEVVLKASNNGNTYEWSTNNGHFVDATLNKSTVRVNQAGDYTLTMKDNIDCCKVVPEIEVITNQCFTNFVVTPNQNCNNDGTFDLEFLFDFTTDISGQGFEFILQNDTFNYTFYPDLPVIVPSISALSNQELTAKIRDGSCYASTSFVAPSCAKKCDISNLILSDTCKNGNLFVYFDFDYSETSDSFLVKNNGEFQGKFAYSQLENNNLFIQLESGLPSYYIEISDKDNSECIIYQTKYIKTCCKIEILSAQTDCKPDGKFDLTIKSKVKGTTIPSFVVNGIEQQWINNDTLNIFKRILKGEDQNLNIKVISEQDDSCVDSTSITAPICPYSCEISNVFIEGFCSSEKYYNLLDFQYDGVGDSFGIKVYESLNSEYTLFFAYSDLPVVYEIFLDPQTGYIPYEIWDINNPDCNYRRAFDVNGNIDCSSCKLSGLTVNQNCNNGEFSFTFDIDTWQGTSFRLREYNLNENEVFNYLDLPITYTPTTNKDVYNFIISDINSTTCQLRFKIKNSCTPNDCVITNFSGEVQDCIDSTFILSFQVDANTQSNGFNIITDTDTIYFAEYNTNYELNLIGDGLSHSIIAQDEIDLSCTKTLNFIAPNCLACNIGEIMVTDSCNFDKQVLTIDFEHPTASDSFHVVIDLGNFGSFSYNDLPINITILENTYNNYEISVIDNNNSNCKSTTYKSINKCNTECKITGFDKEILDCKPNGTFDLKIKVTADYGSSSGYYVIVLGDTSYFSAYDTEYILNMRGNGNFTNIYVIDNEDSSCRRTFSVSSPDCPIESCYLGNLRATGICQNEKLSAVISLDHGASSDSFSLMGNGNDYGVFSYSDIPIHLNLEQDRNYYDFTAIDSENENCKDNIIKLLEPCVTKITDFEGEILGCTNDSTFNFKFKVVPNYDFGQGFYIIDFTNPNLFTNHAYNQYDTINLVADGLIHKIQVYDFNDISIIDTMFIQAPICVDECIITDLVVTPDTNCNSDGTFDIRLIFDIINGLNNGFDLIVNGDTSYFNQYPNSDFMIENFMLGNGQNISITIQDHGNQSCLTTTEFLAPDCNTSNCQIRNITALGSCQANQLKLKVNFEYEQVSDSFFIFGNGENYGYFAYSDLPISIFPEQDLDTYEIVITDAQKSDCTSSIDVETDDCFNIWPGDANNDGIVNIRDLVYFGIAYGSKGPARLDQSTTWLPKPATAFDQSFENGVNYAHADCNGSGQVEWNDMIPISSNYNKNQGIIIPYEYIQGQPTDPILYLDISEIEWESGQKVSIPIILGESDIPIENLYGLSFHIVYPNDLFESGLLVRFDDSWLIKTTTVLQNKQGDLVAIGYTRTFGEGSAGSGIIGTAEGIINQLRSPNGPIKIGIEEAEAFTKSLERIPLRFDTDTISTATYAVDFEKEILVYPNPTSNRITFESPSAIQSIEIFDMLGQIVQTIHSKNEKVEFSTSTLSEGVYFAKIGIEGYIYVKKFEVMR